LLRGHPAVSDVYVYAVSSEFFGEEVAAAVRLRPDMIATEEELKNFCQGKIARFKIPRYFRFVNEFPMTASGKIQKFKLREAHEDELNEAAVKE
jgi:fatty-acyl-CoA synthase